MLFFMAAAQNLRVATDETSNFMLCGILAGVVILALELNAIKGKLGPLTTVKGVIHMGFLLSIALWAIVEFTL